jgi:hypothetical membrane protein
MKFKFLRFFGLFGLAFYWFFVFIAISQNRWFSFYKYALSDLGVKIARFHWLYNLGLIFAWICFFIFSIYLIINSKNKLQTVGGAYVGISSFFLLFISIFVEGTKPHAFMAIYFFLQFFSGMAIFALGSKDKLIKFSMPIVFGLALALIPAKWPSVAMLEVYEISLVFFDVLLIALKYKVA